MQYNIVTEFDKMPMAKFKYMMSYNEAAQQQCTWQKGLMCCSISGNDRGLAKVQFCFEGDIYWTILTPAHFIPEKPVFSVDGFGKHHEVLGHILTIKYASRLRKLFDDFQYTCFANNNDQEGGERDGR